MSAMNPLLVVDRPQPNLKLTYLKKTRIPSHLTFKYGPIDSREGPSHLAAPNPTCPDFHRQDWVHGWTEFIIQYQTTPQHY